MKRLIAPISLALLISACGGSDDASITMKDADGKEVNIKSSGDEVKITNEDGSKTEISSKGSLPDNFPEYPGATDLEVTNINADGSSLTTATFKTSDEPAKVIAFYKADFAERKMPITVETSQNDMAMIMSGENSQAAMAGGNGTTVTAQAEDGATKVSALINVKVK